MLKVTPGKRTYDVMGASYDNREVKVDDISGLFCTVCLRFLARVIVNVLE